MGVSIDDVHAAARRLRNRIHRTPVVSCQSMDDATGFAVFLKCENLQRAGAFKIRGALNKLLSLTADERRRGVVAFSSGNHAQGVALAAQMTGTTSIICMPSDAPKLKLEATRRYGAEVVSYDRPRDDREAVARALAETTADGIRITTPGALTFPVLKANVNDVVLVSDDEVREAVRFLALRAHVVTEPTGAVAAAAVLSRRLPLPAGARVGVVLSGGNVDPDVLGDILRG